MNFSFDQIIKSLNLDFKNKQEIIYPSLFDPQSDKNSWNDFHWKKVNTDTRQINSGDLFVALRGSRFDGHDFFLEAINKGASGVVLEKSFWKKNFKEQSFKNTFVFLVEDTLEALARLAQGHIQNSKALRVAITGTSGKTSVKYFCHQILDYDSDLLSSSSSKKDHDPQFRRQRVPHYFSPQSFNNQFGVPMSILEVQNTDEVALFEVGMNAPGEIHHLAKMINPHICVVTMVGRGHLEGVGSIEGVLQEKMSLYEWGKIHIINEDDSRIFKNYKNFKRPLSLEQIIFSSHNPQADIYFHLERVSFNDLDISGHIQGVSGKARVPLSGRHQVVNVGLASAICSACGVSPSKIWMALSCLKPFWGRNEILKSPKGVSVYFDAYNANPESMSAFLRQSQELESPPFLILGEMLEMGSQTFQLHEELGEQAAQTPHQKIWFIGPSQKAFEQGYRRFEKEKSLLISSTYNDKLAIQYRSMLEPKDWVALKASRGIGLERFLKVLGLSLHDK